MLVSYKHTEAFGVIVKRPSCNRIDFCLFMQVGIAEMKVAIERTGGLVVLSESFGHPVFN